MPSKFEIYVPVCVRFDEHGKPESASVDLEGAPWSYSGEMTGTMYLLRRQAWTTPHEETHDAAWAFIEKALAGADEESAPDVDRREHQGELDEAAMAPAASPETEGSK